MEHESNILFYDITEAEDYWGGYSRNIDMIFVTLKTFELHLYVQEQTKMIRPVNKSSEKGEKLRIYKFKKWRVKTVSVITDSRRQQTEDLME